MREVHTEDRSCAYQCPKCPNIRRRLKRALVDHISKRHPELKGMDVESYAVYQC